MVTRDWLVAELCFLSGRSLFSDKFGDDSLPKQVPLDFIVAMVPFIPDESARLLAHFFVQKRKTLLVDSSQIEPYFGIMISNSYLWQKILSNDI